MSGAEAKQAEDERALFAPPADAAGEALPPPRSIPLAGPPGRLAGIVENIGARRRLAAAVEAEWERGTGFLFAPVCLCLGALLYFSLDTEPAAIELCMITAILGAGAVLARGQIVLHRLFLAAMLVALGMGAAKFETWRAGTKMLGGEISTRVTGRVVQIEQRANGRVRLTIDVLETARPELRYSPDRIRVTARSIPDAITAGSGIAGIVRLRQPSGPVRPGSYDFSFHNYFEGIGASGFFLGAPSAVELTQPASLTTEAAAWLERTRDALARRIRDAVGGPEGAIAAALITGVTAAIPEEANEAMRLSGIYHVISISGLHLALVAGTIIVSMRAGFALFRGFASRRPVKKYAAAIALLVVFFYLFLSGAEVATRRSFIMLAVMLLALLFDRAALTMRNLAIAAILVIAVSPHEVAGPSFQMSFAATAALIAAYAAWSDRRARLPPRDTRQHGLPVRAARFILLYGGGIAVTSIVAGTATALFGAWHFNRVAPLGLVANLLAMPVVSLLVMPFAVLAMLLMPFGLDHLPLAVMGKGIAIMMAIAEWVAARSPFDVVGIVPVEAVLFFCAALVLLTVTKTLFRLAAAPLLLAGILALAAREPPAVLVAEDGRLVALRLASGSLAVNRLRPNGFTIDNWTRALATDQIVRPETDDGLISTAAIVAAPVVSIEGFSCAGGLCLARHESGAVVAHAESAQAALPACGLAGLIVVDDATANDPCPGKSFVITKRDTARHGSAAIRFRDTTTGIRAQATYAISEPFRPWHSHRAFSRPARGMPPYKRSERKAVSTEAPKPAASDSVHDMAAARPRLNEKATPAARGVHPVQ